MVSLVLADGWNHQYPSSPLSLGAVLLQLVYETAGPITYEAPACQEANEVRVQDEVLHQPMHCTSSAFGVTVLISKAGFAGACPAPNTYRGSGATRLKQVRGAAGDFAPAP